ncbi:Alpha/Beta hydrolase protein [Umbelopsis sp. PMI_123]|nr:Alpha/Beta hydrolase protein [Umbelopsis sp. PMI_123]
MCYQGNPNIAVPMSTKPASEDCLALDVLVPIKMKDGPLTVIVMIHGGGYTYGSSNNYVLWLLSGFKNSFSHSEEIQTKLLLMAGSAGGSSVSLQLMVYGGLKDGLLRSAIAEYPWWQSFKPESMQEEQYQTVLKQANSFSSRRFNRVSILTNRETNESTTFSNSSETAQELVHDLNSLFFNPPQSFLDTLDKLYPPSAYNNSVFNRRKAIFGDDYINCGTELIASSSVHYSKSPSPLFKFILSASSGGHGSLYVYLTTENVNGSFGLNNTLSYFLQDYYLSLINHQDPNVKKNRAAPHFSSYASGNQILLVSDEDVVPGIDLHQRGQCYFFYRWPNQTNN